jgi:hypothetical protein
MYLLQVRIAVADDDADELSQGDTFRNVTKRARQYRVPRPVVASVMKAAGALLSHPTLHRAAIATADVALNVLPRFALYNRLNAWGKHREVPHAPRQTFHSWYKKNRGTP